MLESICIVGAGSAGICVARRCYEAGFSNITVFEQSDKVGGLWNYTDEINMHSSMYDKLITNIPRPLIGFKDFSVPDYNNSGRSFFPRDEFLRYLNEFAEPIKRFIKLEICVTYIKRDQKKWKVEVKNSKSELSTSYFDVIFVCNGVCTVPDFPDYAEKYKGETIHSHNFRKVDPYKGKNIAIIGAGLSGTDICEQISQVAKKVYLLYKEANLQSFEFPSNVIKLPQVVNADETNLYLADGNTLTNIDMVIYCTGYRYNFPFLDSDIIKVKNDGKVVTPLFEHVAHRDFLNSFFIIGLNFWAITSLLFESQIRFAIALIKGEASGFTEKDIKAWEGKRTRALLENNESLRHFHCFEHPSTCHQWEYFDQLLKYANVKNWVPPVFSKISMHFTEAWRKQPCEYRKVRYKILNEEEFEFEKI